MKKNKKNLDGFLILLGFLNLISFVGFAVSNYSVNLKNIELQKEINYLQEDIINTFDEVFSVTDEHSTFIRSINEDLLVKSNKISVIEESLDPQNTRWAKIKLVRDSIKFIITKKSVKKHSIPDIQGLTLLASSVVDYSEEYDVPISLILGITTRESAFNYKIVSHAGAQGLMQIMPGTAKEISKDVGQRHYNMYKIKDNIHFGVWYIWKMMDRFNGDVELAVRAYNCGPTCVEKVQAGLWLNYPEETQEYVKAVLEWKLIYEKMGL